MAEMKSSHFVKLAVNHLAAKYSAKHRCTKCGFPSVILIIIPSCSTLSLRRNLFARSKSYAFIAPRSPFLSLGENKDIKAAIMCFAVYDSFFLFYFWF